MIRVAAACLTAALLCTGCILTEEDLDCWYDDMCMTISGNASILTTLAPTSEAPTPPSAR